jgi:AcrR family transcriptional regulator
MNKRSFTTQTTTTKPAAKTTPAAKPRARKSAEAESPENRDKILRAAEALFSTKGFNGTGLREVAEKAGVSLGNIYNHFADKKALFEALLETLEKQYLDPSQPLPKALAEIDFPDGLEKLGHASRDTVKRFASYIRLIYVDVIEFEGAHVARVYGGMMDRYRAAFSGRIDAARSKGALSEADPLVAIMMTTIVYMYYFTVEHLFGVKKHYGLDDDQIIREFAKVFKLGILKR